MCLSTIYTVSGDKETEVMTDVARLEREEAGIWAIDLFGERTFVEGTIKSVDLMNGKVMVESPISN